MPRDHEPRLARAAAMVADAARSRMLARLLSGEARCCYGHLAGRLGVGRALALTPSGRRALPPALA
ncbi:MAG: hypothetical protein JSR75_08315 [Proteobacteria bacterium]|nr:hypothetical protein [Pseudomonadota bacterium]